MAGPLGTSHLLTEGKALDLPLVIATLQVPAMILILAVHPILLLCLTGPLQCHTGVGVQVHPHVGVLSHPLFCHESTALLHPEAPFPILGCLPLEGLHQHEPSPPIEWPHHLSSLAQHMLCLHMWTPDQV